MKRRSQAGTPLTVLDLGRLLDSELPLPDPMLDRDAWRAAMALRYARGVHLGFGTLDVIRGGLASRHGSRYPGFDFCQRQTGGLR